MGLLKLLTFPVSLPLAGGEWVLRTIQTEAERRYYDESAILEEMAQLEQQLRDGVIDETIFDAHEQALLQRLLDARAYRAQQRDRTDMPEEG
jgi:hypothetical protein